jgi:hypothetical protein
VLGVSKGYLMGGKGGDNENKISKNKNQKRQKENRSSAVGSLFYVF